MRAVALAVMVLACSTALAAGEDLANCLWGSGATIEPRICEGLRQLDARDTARAEQQARQEAAARGASAQAIIEREAAEAPARAAAVERAERQRARFDAEEAARQAARDKQLRDEDAHDRQVQATVAARRKVCGDDYGKPRVGMRIERAQQCVGNFRLVGQQALPGGVVSTYRAGWAFLTVRDGVIVAFQVP